MLETFGFLIIGVVFLALFGHRKRPWWTWAMALLGGLFLGAPLLAIALLVVFKASGGDSWLRQRGSSSWSRWSADAKARRRRRDASKR